MEFKKGLFDGENIPDFALQPARPAASFDPTVYDRLFENLKKSSDPSEEVEPVEKVSEPIAKSLGADQTEKTGEKSKPAKFSERILKEPSKETIVEKETAVISNSIEEKEVAKVSRHDKLAEEEQVAEAEAEAEVLQPIEEKAAEDEVAEVSQPIKEKAEEEQVAEVSQPMGEKAVEEVAEVLGPIEEKLVAEEKAEEEAIAEVSQDVDEKAEDEVAEVLGPIEEKVVEPVRELSRPVRAAKAVESADKSQTLPTPTNQKFRKVKYRDFGGKESFIVKVEEDILITDVKPDMAEMLNILGNCRLAERNVTIGTYGTHPLRLMGDLTIQALYAAESGNDEPEIVPVDSRIPFREDFTVKTEGESNIVLKGEIVSISCKKINERKFKVNAEIEVIARKYIPREMDIFEGIDNEILQMLPGEMEYTDIPIRRTEQFEISEEENLPEGAAEIDQILCYDVNIVEGHKQIGSDKAMISGLVNINFLYDSMAGPVFYNCKSDFTHFMKMDEGVTGYPLLGGRADFNIVNCSLTPKRNEDGYFNTLCLDMEAEVDFEYYRQLQEPYVLDAYHYSKDISCGRAKNVLNCLQGGGAIDIPIREIVDVTDLYGKLDKVIYITGSPRIKKDQAVQGKIEVEGLLPVKITCISAESGSLPFVINKDLQFRSEIDVAGCKEGMQTDCQVTLKDLAFDQINNRQVSINGELHVSGFALEQKPIELINSVAVVERKPETGPTPSIIVYAAKNDDTVWRVSKKYHIPISRLRSINDLSDHEELKPGAKILIVK